VRKVFIIPISNLAIESAFKMGDIFFSPPKDIVVSNIAPFNNSITEIEFENIKKYLTVLEATFGPIFFNSTLAITSFEEVPFKNSQEAFAYVNRICEKVDRSMDYLRLQECQIGNFETLPGLAGIMDDGFKTVYQIDLESNICKMIPGEVTILLRTGIGLMPFTEPDASNPQSLEYQCIFNDRSDEVFLNCRAALTRVNEAMYMHNLNTAFVYLMTTIEMLADKDKFINFKGVKPKIIPFIAKSKKEYHSLSTYLFTLSKSKREEIVHNGKNIFDLYENSNQVKVEIFKITGIIIIYVHRVISTNIDNFEDLECKRQELLREIGV
jgi:DNA-binding ferritin-like protein (Dps family)